MAAPVHQAQPVKVAAAETLVNAVDAVVQKQPPAAPTQAAPGKCQGHRRLAMVKLSQYNLIVYRVTINYPSLFPMDI